MCHYIALNGISEKPILKLLELYPNINQVILGLDYDTAGIEANEKIRDLLIEKGGLAVESVRPEYKDWNECLKARHGIAPIQAVEHPQLDIRDKLWTELGENVRLFINSDITLEDMRDDFERCRRYMSKGDFARAKEYFKDLTAISLISAAKEYTRMTEGINTSILHKRLKHQFRFCQNRGKIDNKMSDISFCLKSLFLLQKKILEPGDKSRAEGFERLFGELFKAAILNEQLRLSQLQEVEATQSQAMELS